MRCLGLVVAALLFSSASAAKILVLSPSPGRSHAIIFDRLVLELAKRGNDVTIITAFNQTNSHKNLHQIVIPNQGHKLLAAMGMSLFEMKNLDLLGEMRLLSRMGDATAESFFELDQVKKVLESKEKYDVIIGEAFLNEAILGGFAHKFQAPLVAFSSGPISTWTENLVGNPAPSSYIPLLSTGYPVKMSFCQRIKNFLLGTFAEIFHADHHMKHQDLIMRKYLGDDLPPLSDIVKNTSMLLLNHHHSLAFPRPFLPNVIQVAGIHVHEPKPLPEDLKEYLDNSKDGFVLFSMGSNIKSSAMPKERIQMFLDAFSRLKQNVLWKFENDNLPGQPKNVKIGKWLPQSDILAHPNLKLFITHGGILSTIESVLRGIPVIGIPVYGDQKANIKLAEDAGYGLSLDLDSITTDSLEAAIKEVLNNPKYAETAQLRSDALRGEPETALDRACFWVEYVARHKGAHHLRSAAHDLSWYQYYLLDVILFLVVLISVGLFAISLTAKFVFKKLFCYKHSKKGKVSQKKKNK